MRIALLFLLVIVASSVALVTRLTATGAADVVFDLSLPWLNSLSPIDACKTMMAAAKATATERRRLRTVDRTCALKSDSCDSLAEPAMHILVLAKLERAGLLGRASAYPTAAQLLPSTRTAAVLPMYGGMKLATGDIIAGRRRHHSRDRIVVRCGLR